MLTLLFLLIYAVINFYYKNMPIFLLQCVSRNKDSGVKVVKYLRFTLRTQCHDFDEHYLEL